MVSALSNDHWVKPGIGLLSPEWLSPQQLLRARWEFSRPKISLWHNYNDDQLPLPDMLYMFQNLSRNNLGD